MFVVGTQDSCFDSHMLVLDGDPGDWDNGACPAGSVATNCVCEDTKDEIIQAIMEEDNVSALEAEEIWQEEVAENNNVEPLCVTKNPTICSAAGAVWMDFTEEGDWTDDESFDIAQCVPGEVGECYVDRCPGDVEEEADESAEADDTNLDLNSKTSDVQAERISSIGIGLVGLVGALLIC